MPQRFKDFLSRWLITAVAVLVAASVVSNGIHYRKPMDVVLAALLLGILHALLRPLLVFFTLPLMVLSLGLFSLIINAGLLLLVSALLQPAFVVDSFWPAFWGALVISIVSWLLSAITGVGKFTFRLSRAARAAAKRPPGPNLRKPTDRDDGPIIDI